MKIKNYEGCRYKIEENQGAYGGYVVVALVDDSDDIGRWPQDAVVSGWLGEEIISTASYSENTCEAVYYTATRPEAA